MSNKLIVSYTTYFSKYTTVFISPSCSGEALIKPFIAKIMG